MTEQAQRLAPANLSLRDRIERRLRPEAGSGSPDTALIAGLEQTHGSVQQLRQYLPKTWSRAAVLIPLVDHIVRRVSVADRRIDIDPPEGLIEVNRRTGGAR